jgi:hypothetical protein
MKIRFSIFLYVVALLCHSVNSAYSQSNLPTVVSPAPEAASLGKFADIPVGLYNGIPEINIPIYSIPINGQSIPISVSYHAGGIKVAEIPSSTGSGWALNAGGVITRTIRGQDDATGNGFQVSPAIPIGSSCLSGADAQNYLYEAANLGHYDTEPDMFYFNFNGRVGKFVVDKSGNVHQIPYSNLKILPTTSGFAGWKVTTEDGVEYDFNVEEILEYSQVPSPIGNASFSSQSYMSSWYLSQIKYPNSSQTVTFEYTTDRITYDLPLSEQRYEYSQASSGSNSCPLILDVNQLINAHNSLYAYRLTKIDFPNGNLEFIPGNYRKDYTNGRTLGQININNSNSLLKSFRFQYEYLSTAYSGPIADDGTATATTVADTRMRLHLTSIQEYGSDGTTQKSPYLFTYNTSILLPDRLLSRALDHWGYYNGHDENTTIIPTHDYYNVGTYIGGIRDPSSQYAQANILTQITYPTGGTTQFTFESNQANTTLISAGVPQTQQATYQIGHCYLTTGSSGNFTVNDINGSVKFSVSLYAAGTDPSASTGDPYTLTGKSCPTNTTGSIPSSVFNYIYFQILDVTDLSNPQVVFNQDGSQMFLAGSGMATMTSIVLPNGNYKLKGIKGNSDFSANAPEITDYDGNFDPVMVFQLTGTTYTASSSGAVAATIGGVRIKQMTDYDPISQKSITKTYDYTNNGQSSGVINWMPVYYYPYNEDDYGCNDSHGTYYYNIYGSTSVLPLTEMQGGNVGYSKITVSYLNSQNQPGMNGKTEYYYTNPQDYYFAQTYQSASFNPVNTTVCFANEGSTNSFLFKFPYAPPVCPEWAKGLLTNQIDYLGNADGSYSKVKEIDNTYKTDYLGAAYDYNLSQDVIAAKIAISTKMKNNDAYGNFDSYVLQYYYIPSRYSKLIETDETAYNSSQSITAVKTFAYDNLSNLQPTSTTLTDSKGDIYKSVYKYPTDFPSDPAYSSMITNNMINPLIQQDNYKNNSMFLSENKTNYNIWPNNVIAPASVQTTQLSNPVDLRLQFYSYDNNGNILDVSKSNGLHNSYQWGYNAQYPVAKITNAPIKDIFYANFEEGDGNSAMNDAKTGHYSYDGSTTAYSKALNSLDAGVYILSYWLKSGGVWSLQTSSVTVNGNTYTISLSGQIDDVRFYPVTAQMTTYTYEPLIGMTSQCDVNNKVIYYEYDPLGRLLLIRDFDNNIIKRFDYKYQQPN